MTREERVALESYRGLSEVVHEAAGVVVLTVPQAPGIPMLNRIVGLGVDGPATEEAVDAALAVIPAGVTYYVAVAPGALPLHLPGWLEARGLEQGWGWMSFRRSPASPPQVETSLRLARVESRSEAEAFARIQRVAYGLPEPLEPLLAQAPESRLGVLDRARRRRARRGGRAVRAGGRRLSRLRRDAARAPRQGRAGCAARAQDRPRGGARLRRRAHRDGRAPRRPTVQLVPEHPPRRVRGGRGDRQLGRNEASPRLRPLRPTPSTA